MKMINRSTALAGMAGAFASISIHSTARAADFTMKLGSDAGAQDPHVIAWIAAADAIRQKTNGLVDIKVFPGSQLGDGPEMLSQVRSGSIDFFPVSDAVGSRLVPTLSISNVGFAFKSYDDVWKTMDGSLGRLLRRQLEASGELIAFEKVWNNGFRQITSSDRPIASPADLKGFKIRVPPSPIFTSMFSDLGAAPTAIPFTDLYTSLQTKLVDGQENPLTQVEIAKFFEVQKYCSLTNHSWSCFWLVGNRRSWNSLPANVQRVVAQEFNAAALTIRVTLAKAELDIKSRLQAHGMIFNQPRVADFQAALKATDFYRSWKNNFGPEVWTALEQNVGKLV
jgi:tripartite ATP-independent transporter DctP family solute receptor